MSAADKLHNARSILSGLREHGDELWDRLNAARPSSFDYTTGDAAGQNLTGKATAAACAWITANYEPGIERFLLGRNRPS